MSNKHTPGPWKAEFHGSVWHIEEGSHFPPVQLACVYVWTEDGGRKEAAANARLMAAAPELLAEIQSALATAQDGLEHMDSGDEEGARMALDVICSGLEDAINNATKEEA